MQTEHILETWNKKECVRFAVWCARKVMHLNDDPSVEAAVSAAEAWLEDPSDRKAVAAAAYANNVAIDAAVDAASYSAKHISAGFSASYAASAAANSVAAATGRTSYASCASYAAGYAAHAMGLKDHDLLNIYLSEMLIGIANA